MQRLKLVRTAEQIAALLQDAGKKDLPYSDFLSFSRWRSPPSKSATRR